jgi:methyl-accepting chemotaxis protein
MDEMTQRNGALVEETSASAQALSEQAAQLAQLVGFFRLGGEGARSPAPSPAAAPKPASARPAEPKPVSTAAAPKPAAPPPAPKLAAVPKAAPAAAVAAADDDWQEF